MNAEHLYEHSPLKLLQSSPHGQLGAGQLGVISARAGVGKTACLVQVGLAALLQGKRLLHISLGGQTVSRVQAWYDTLFVDLANFVQLEARNATRTDIDKLRLIQSYASNLILPEQIERSLELYAKHMSFAPEVVLIDNFDWTGDPIATAAALGALKASAQRMGAALWLTARSHREDPISHPLGLAPPCDTFSGLIDVALRLAPEADAAELTLLKDRSDVAPEVPSIQLQVDTMRALTEGGWRSTVTLPAGVCTLLSGGAQGAESAFGDCAERWGLTEIHYSFKGRPVSRNTGVLLLSDEQLQQGRVNARYLQEHMHRSYPDTPLFQKVLQSIWHQVNTAGQVFVIGIILEDNTVKGGTGWAAELAKHLNKELFVFDQERQSWLLWDNDAWHSLEEAPRITSRRFTGTGSRFLSDQGRAAIEDLFRGSFGPPSGQKS